MMVWKHGFKVQLIGPPEKWTLGRKGHLQKCCLLIILGILGRGSWVGAITPGEEVFQQKQQEIQWGWRNHTKSRVQDDFMCGEYKGCATVNVTVSKGYIWTPPSTSRYRPNYCLYDREGQIILHNATKISCCNLPRDFIWKDYPTKIKDIKQCQNGTGVLTPNRNNTYISFPMTNLSVFACYNATEIKNRTDWVQYMVLIDKNNTILDPGHIKRIPSTCQKVGLNLQKVLLTVEVSFPKAETCKVRGLQRKKRAWYDTILGTYGSVTGTLNGFDIETLANRMHYAGAGINKALRWQAEWMPTLFTLHKAQSRINFELLDIQNASLYWQKGLAQNLSSFVNWTVCSVKTLMQMQQKDAIQSKLMTGNLQVWQGLLNISQPHIWLKLESALIKCTDTLCQGDVILYNVTEVDIMCTFLALPLIIGNYYWMPQFTGTHIDSKNMTHDLSLCENTLEGMLCTLHSPINEPCLLKNTVNVCPWTILPLHWKMLMEISSQTICMVTNEEVIPRLQVPFSGCLANVSTFKWENRTYILHPDIHINVTKYWLPDAINIPNWNLMLSQIEVLMKKSEKVKTHEKLLNASIIQHQIYTTIVANEIVKIGSEIEKATEHHWYDIFMGYSPSATKMLNFLIHPVLIMAIVICLLSIWNGYIAYRMFCRRPQVMMYSYNE